MFRKKICKICIVKFKIAAAVAPNVQFMKPVQRLTEFHYLNISRRY